MSYLAGLGMIIFIALVLFGAEIYYVESSNDITGIVASKDPNMIRFVGGRSVTVWSGDKDKIKVGQECTIKTSNFHLDYVSCVPINISIREVDGS
jgi:hypothetical protein